MCIALQDSYYKVALTHNITINCWYLSASILEINSCTLSYHSAPILLIVKVGHYYCKENMKRKLSSHFLWEFGYLIEVILWNVSSLWGDLLKFSRQILNMITSLSNFQNFADKNHIFVLNFSKPGNTILSLNTRYRRLLFFFLDF